MIKRPLYLDYNSTTPLDKRVLEVMLPYLTEKFGNSMSGHFYGWEAKAAVDLARKKLAGLCEAKNPDQIIFTNSSSQANQLVFDFVFQNKKGHFISQQTEHRSVKEPLEKLNSQNCEVTFLKVDDEGFVDLNHLKNSIKEYTTFVSIMMANNEIGTIQPIFEISEILKDKNILFHVDAAQACGKIPLDVSKLNADFVTFSSHKIYGPKGISALYVKNPAGNLNVDSEINFGTQNVAGIIGMAKAYELCMDELEIESKRQTKLRDKIIQTLLKNCDHSFLNGPTQNRLPNNINISFLGVKNDDLIASLTDIAISTGSACSTVQSKPSQTIQALTDNDLRIKSAVRISLGRMTTDEEVDVAIEMITNKVKLLRKSSIDYEMILKK